MKRVIMIPNEAYKEFYKDTLGRFMPEEDIQFFDMQKAEYSIAAGMRREEERKVKHDRQ